MLLCIFDDLYHTSSGGATVDVTIHLEQSDKLTPPTSAASPKALPPQSSSLSKALPTSAPSGSKVIATPPHSSLSARRNLTRSFEEASLNTPSSKTTTGECCQNVYNQEYSYSGTPLNSHL